MTDPTVEEIRRMVLEPHPINLRARILDVIDGEREACAYPSCRLPRHHPEHERGCRAYSHVYREERP